MTQVTLYASIGKDLHKLDGLWTSIEWSGETVSVFRTLRFTLNNTRNAITPLISIPNGSKVRMIRTRDKAELFRGRIFKISKNNEGSFSYDCYDDAFFMTKNETRVSYRGKTATEIFRDICKKYGYAVGSVADTKKKLDKLKFRGMSLDKIINTALTETRQAGGKKYRVTCEKGKMNLREVSTLKFAYKADTRSNIISSSFSSDNTDRKTAVKLTGGKEEAKPTISAKARDEGSIKRYGLMTHYEHKSNFTRKSKLNDFAKKLLDKLDVTKAEFTIETLGNVGFKAGRRIHVTDPMTGKKGLYYITTDSHRFNSDGTHTVSMQLNSKVKLAVENYKPPSEPTKKTKEVTYVTTSGKFTTTTYTSGWTATAYAYRAGGTNGSKSGITASSTKIDEGRSIAVDPSVIPLGSVVAIYNASNKQYNGLYLAEDTGGAIKGKKIDIAMVTIGEARKWGKRTISVAIIEKGKGRADARAKAKSWSKVKARIESKMRAKAQSIAVKASAGTNVAGKAAKVVAIAKSELGKHVYTFGGKRYGIYDCSGWTKYVYSKVGVNIGDGTSNQAFAGRYIKRSQIQAGDLIILKNTYRSGVSHVGIAISNSKMIHQGGPNGKRGPTIASIAPGSYFGGSKHYHSARRVL